MPTFPRNRLPSARSQALQRAVRKRPFLLFGLPFIGIVVAGSFFLTPVTANRYDHHDRKRRWVGKQDAFDSTGLQRRKFDAREEYYVRTGLRRTGSCGTDNCCRDWLPRILATGSRGDIPGSQARWMESLSKRTVGASQNEIEVQRRPVLTWAAEFIHNTCIYGQHRPPIIKPSLCRYLALLQWENVCFQLSSLLRSRLRRLLVLLDIELSEEHDGVFSEGAGLRFVWRVDAIAASVSSALFKVAGHTRRGCAGRLPCRQICR
jgi:cytochrome c oxidase assembly protein subunit 16